MSYVLLLPWILIFAATAAAQSSVRFINAETGKPVSGLSVYAPNRTVSAQTNSNGWVSIHAGTYSAGSPGFLDYTFELTENTPNRVVFLWPVSSEIIDEIGSSDHFDSLSFPPPTFGTETGVTATHSFADRLQPIPGIALQRASSLPAGISIRGMQGKDVLYTMNGFRLNPSFSGSDFRILLTLFDPFQTDWIEVKKGGSAFPGESDALSGAVVVRMNSPVFSEKPNLSVNVLSQFNAGGTGEKTLSGSLKVGANRISLRAGGTVREFSTYSMPKGTDANLWFPYTRKLDHAAYSYNSANGQLGFRFFKKTTLTLNGFWSLIPSGAQTEKMVMGYSYLFQPPRTFPEWGYASQTEPLGVTALHATLRIPTEIPLVEHISLKGGFHYFRNHRKTVEFNKTPVFGTGDALFDLSEYYELDKARNEQWMSILEIISRLPNGMKVRWGAEYSADFVGSKRTFHIPAAGITEPRLSRYPDKSNMNRAGVFAYTTAQISSKTRLEGGVRFSTESLELPFEGVYDPFGRGLAPISQDFSILTWNLQANYQMNSSDRLFVISGSGFRLPNVADLTALGPRRNQTYTQWNASLKPERSTHFETGFERTESHFRIRTSLFISQYSNRIVPIRSGKVVDLEGEVISGRIVALPGEFYEYLQSNSGKQFISGFELDASTTLHRLLESGFQFTFLYGRSDEGNGFVPVSFFPQSGGLLFAVYKPFSWISVRPEARFALNQYDIPDKDLADSRINPLGTDGFLLANLMVLLQPSKQVQARVRLENVFNTVYRDHGSSVDGLQRNLTFTAVYSF